jgi:hypothetical protein
MIFSIDDYDQLMALHRVMMEAKFTTDPNDSDIQGSPLVAAIAHQIVETLAEMDSGKTGEAARSKWQAWRTISPERREYQIIQTKLSSAPGWRTLSASEQTQYVKDLVSPLLISDELIRQLIG